ncbi:hypothetical protein [Lichenicoccus roseus]|uniref:hypothetical protein n=1 Tax=Lichenicoccus roseus TaxID=2683649 RepID=UPI001F0DE7EF|nr:hypothetical protein [Lichenicoccus roseus]
MAWVGSVYVCFLLQPGAAQAQADPQALSTNLPVRLKDAFVTDPGAVTLQYGSRTTIEDDGRYSLRGGPALKFGLPGRIELSLAPFRQLGDASSVHGNLAGAELEWNLNQQSRHIPAFLLALIRDEPYGGGHQGPHYAVQGVATKSLGGRREAPRLGVEVAWTHTVGAATDERHGRWLAGIVWSRLLDRRTALVADLVYQQQNRRGHESDYLDVGFNRIVGRSLTLSAGLGPGLAQDAAAVRVFAGIKWTIKDALPWQ